MEWGGLSNDKAMIYKHNDGFLVMINFGGGIHRACGGSGDRTKSPVVLFLYFEHYISDHTMLTYSPSLL